MEEFETGKQARRRTRPTHEPEIVSEFGKLPPQETSMEEAVLGALMLEKDAYNNVCEILKPEAFYNPANQKIYEAIQSLAASGKPIDMLTVTEQLRNNKALEEVGGAVRISELTGLVSSAANAEFHARIVAQKYLARELISYSSNISTLAFDDSIDVYDLMQEAEGKLFEQFHRDHRPSGAQPYHTSRRKSRNISVNLVGWYRRPLRRKLDGLFERSGSAEILLALWKVLWYNGFGNELRWSQYGYGELYDPRAERDGSLSG